MAKKVDARGLACPQPVILTKKALDQEDDVTTIVDNDTAVENVLKLATDQGCKISIEKKGESIYVHMVKRETGLKESAAAPAPESAPLNKPEALQVSKSMVLLITSDTIGRGDDDLGRRLMRSFTDIIGQVTPVPDKIIFMNSGVKLVAGESEMAEDLLDLTNHGIEVLACGTCLEHYNLKSALKVGRVSNMYEISSALFQSAKTITL